MIYALQPFWGETYIVSPAMTGNDLLALLDDGSKHELFEGIVVRETMTSLGHGIICQRLGGMLFVYAQQAGFRNTIVQNALFDLTPIGAPRWLIDLATRQVEVWTAQGQALFNDTQMLSSPLLPGFGVAIAYLLDG